MRKPRVLGEREVNYYHVMSRVVNRDYIFGDKEKEFFRLTMRRLEAFMGLRILTYCIMSNHWHILLEVPETDQISDDALMTRLKSFYSKSQYSSILKEFNYAQELLNETGSDFRMKQFRNRYTSRMGDLSVFVKELKERFSKWYNRKHHRRGTLWEERFKSVLVENSDHALSTMAAYIDLNPVRAGLISDPREYRFCGYADAVAGGSEARQGIMTVLHCFDPQISWRKAAAQYRSHLFASGEKTETRQGVDPEKVKKVIATKGELKLHELIQCHVRYFNDGVALGSRLFIEEVFEQHRSHFSERRKTGARKMKGGHWQGLYNMRDFGKDAITAPG